MAFGGTVPLGALTGGWLADVVGITPVLVGGPVASVALVLYADLVEPMPTSVAAAGVPPAGR
jgi:hypothetical protein